MPLEWSRFGLWLAAILRRRRGLAAAGAALGAAAREVRAVSLLAFMVTLPVAFLSLVPSGTVGDGLFDVIKVITALFPFKPALEAITAALDPGNGPARRPPPPPGDPRRRLRRAVHILGLQASAHILEALEPALAKGPLRRRSRR